MAGVRALAGWCALRSFAQARRPGRLCARYPHTRATPFCERSEARLARYRAADRNPTEGKNAGRGVESRVRAWLLDGDQGEIGPRDRENTHKRSARLL